MQKRRMFFWLSLFLLLAPGTLVQSQEVKYIDLTAISQRTELRHPPASPGACQNSLPCPDGACGCGYAHGHVDGINPSYGLGAFLTSVTPTYINPAQPFEAEFKVLNTGVTSIGLPVSPHLSVLQPSDASARFEYSSLELIVRASGVPDGPKLKSYAAIKLYGAADHPDTMVILQPGEWIRVKANMKLQQPPPGLVDVQFRGEFSTSRNTFLPYPGGAFTDEVKLPLIMAPTPWVTVRLAE